MEGNESVGSPSPYLAPLFFSLHSLTSSMLDSKIPETNKRRIDLSAPTILLHHVFRNFS